MQVENVLVEELLVDEANRFGLEKSTLYEFKEPRWISIHREREGRRLKPMILIDEPQDRDEKFNGSIRSFGDRWLHAEGKPDRLVVSYRDRWTVPLWTIYALVLLKCFVITHINLAREEQAGWKPQLQLGASHDERLFYHTVFEWVKVAIFSTLNKD